MIVFDQVEKSYAKELFSDRGRLTALSGLSFVLPAGRTLGLVGANGAGKSTSIRLLMDFIRPDKGSISLFEEPPDRAAIRRRIGYLPETASFPANLTVMDLLRFTGHTCGLNHRQIEERGAYWLNELDLWPARKKLLRTYSKGMQQRANFVLALLNDPQLLVLDEPMSGLDPLGRYKITTLVKRLKGEGKTILFCSHILEDVDNLVDDLLVLHRGHKLYYGTPVDFVKQQDTHSVEAAFVELIQRESHHAQYDN